MTRLCDTENVSDKDWRRELRRTGKKRDERGDPVRKIAAQPDGRREAVRGVPTFPALRDSS